MSELINWLMNFFKQFKLLTIVLPWERAARIRLGSRVVVWEPGWHIRLPFIDEIVPMNSRLRIADTGSQTLTTLDGHTLYFTMNIGFRISDPLAVLMRMQHPESSCSAIAGSVAANIISRTCRGDLTVDGIETYVSDALKRETPYDFEFVRIRDFAYARAFRLLNENAYRSACVNIEERKL